MEYLVELAPHLTNPLVLIGLVVLGIYGVVKALIASGILPQVSKKDSGGIVRLFLHYGFFVALVVSANRDGIYHITTLSAFSVSIFPRAGDSRVLLVEHVQHVLPDSVRHLC